ncbi:uncharacterized protein V1516DRAFT_673260 [Lipomyces oligophaga]|uniref:uncharacterized protein n=1 Tax=Lipomyces oligophaga TaxID=45792 RepID=UPI0034CE12F8
MDKLNHVERFFIRSWLSPIPVAQLMKVFVVYVCCLLTSAQSVRAAFKKTRFLRFELHPSFSSVQVTAEKKYHFLNKIWSKM